MGMAADESCSKGSDLRPSSASDGRRLLRYDTSKLQRTRPKPSPPLTTISKLQDDLLVEILVRLPDARSAFRCRSVCKRWRSLISDPQFRRRFLSHHHSGSEEALVLSSQDARDFLPVPADVRPNLSVQSSCNDLVLCGFDIAPNKSGENQCITRLFFVCNPFTKQWVALPLVTFLCGQEIVTLVCETDRFRVVCFTGSYFSPDVDLFCSESNEWTKKAPNLNSKYHHFKPACCNGKLYWPTIHPYKFAVWDPFRPDTPPTSIDAVARLWEGNGELRVWTAQGALHMVCFSSGGGGSWDILSVCRLEEQDGGSTWRTLTTASVRACKFAGPYHERDLKLRGLCALHSSNPEIVFLEFLYGAQRQRVVFSLNVGTREATFCRSLPIGAHWRVFHARFAGWPSPIPNYEKLQDTYKWLVPRNESIRARTNTECQSVEGVEQLDRPRKHSGSEPSSLQPLRSPVKKKQKVVKDRSDQLADVVHALQAMPDVDDQLLLDACDLFEDDSEKAAIFLALEGRTRKKWLLRKLCPKDSV